MVPGKSPFMRSTDQARLRYSEEARVRLEAASSRLMEASSALDQDNLGAAAEKLWQAGALAHLACIEVRQMALRASFAEPAN